MAKQNTEVREKRKQWFCDMDQKLQESWSSKEDSLFYYHSSEGRIVLSHALFWTMTQLQFFKGKMRKEKYFLLLRQYEEEMLDAFSRRTIISLNCYAIAISFMRCCPLY